MSGRGGAFPGDDDDDALPWLEPAENDDEDEGDGGFPYRGLMVAGGLVVAVVALLWFVADRFGGAATAPDVVASGEVPLIQAPEGPYKERRARRRRR